MTVRLERSGLEGIDREKVVKMGEDLSSYERLRLENIKRNNAFLASLGLDDIIASTEIWGIGPGKIRSEPEKGWAWELREQLDSAECIALLVQSRAGS